MNLQQLHYFTTLANANHYGKAARQLFITQPALSNAIKSLEKELGYELFNRTAEGVFLTKYGQMCYEHIALALHEIDCVVNLMNPTATDAQIIRLGIVVSLDHTYLQTLLSGYIEQSGFQTSFDLIEKATTFDCINSVKQARLDAALCGQAPKTAHMGWIPLMPFNAVIAVNNAHPLAQKAEVSLIDLRKFCISSYRSNSYLYWAFKNLLKQYNVECRQAFLTEISGLSLIQADTRIAALLLDVFKGNPPKGVSFISIKELHEPFHMVGLVYNLNTKHNKAAKGFINHLSAISQSLNMPEPLEAPYMEELLNKEDSEL